MLPVLFTLRIPAGLGAAAAILAAVLVLLFRAVGWVRRARAEGEDVSLLEALRGDAAFALLAAAAIGIAWRAGLLAGEVRLPVHTYGLLIAAGFLLGLHLAQREARRRGQDPERLNDLAFWILGAAIVGSHVYFVLVNWRDYLTPATFLVEAPGVARVVRTLTLGAVEVERFPRALLPAGLVFYGGFIAAALCAAWYMRRHRMPFLAHADTIIPSVALGHFFGRLGCFGAGCCWGGVAHGHLPWAARFPPSSLAYQTFAGREDPGAFLAPDRLATLPLHPTQLYESFGELGLFLLLVLVVRPRKRFHGQVLASWLLLYAVLRATVELFRGDVERGVWHGLGAGQWTSIAILAAGALIWARARRSAALAAAGAAPV